MFTFQDVARLASKMPLPMSVKHRYPSATTPKFGRYSFKLKREKEWIMFNGTLDDLLANMILHQINKSSPPPQATELRLRGERLPKLAVVH
jgi:hypothetical protein